jgi:LmbE family N-acetylglucosaminyl deacetylase
MPPASRREFVQNSLAGLGLLSLAPLAQAETASAPKRLKVVCVGGHPDDPESGCGGTLARLAAAGHSISIIYLTRGEHGIKNKSHDEAGQIRTKEAEAACVVLKAKPLFAGQIDGETVFNNEWISKLQQMIADEKPDVVFTHWPIDTHKDHQIASLLTYQVWAKAQEKFEMYFYEVCTGEQTTTFHPTNYVDISDVQDQKRQAIYCHTSQHPDSIYGPYVSKKPPIIHGCGHGMMEQYRGAEIGVAAAEAFVRLTGLRQGNSIAGL